MKSVSRQQTRTSIHSWWSDRNPGLQGPTVNLHAATKPLMRLMYHRQALNFMKRNEDIPLSSETMQIYCSYIFCNYVSDSTKAAILGELERRAHAKDEVCTISEEPFLLAALSELLGSPNVGIRRAVCWLMGRLTSYRSITPVILQLKPCVPLMSLLRDGNFDVISGATFALCGIACEPDGAQAAVDAKVLDHVIELLQSPWMEVRKWACWLVGRLAFHGSRAPPLELKLLISSQVSDENIVVMEGATYALSQVPRSADGARTAVDAKVLGFLLDLLASSTAVREWACWLVGNLASQGAIAPASLKVRLCEKLVYLLRGKNVDVTAGAMYALSQVARSVDGAQAAVRAKVLGHVVDFFESPSAEVRRWSCRLVGNLVRHETTAPAVLASSSSRWLLFLLLDTEVAIRASAIFALAELSQWPGGVAALKEIGALEALREPSKSVDRDIQAGIRTLQENLARYIPVPYLPTHPRPSHPSIASSILPPRFPYIYVTSDSIRAMLILPRSLPPRSDSICCIYRSFSRHFSSLPRSLSHLASPFPPSRSSFLTFIPGTRVVAALVAPFLCFCFSALHLRIFRLTCPLQKPGNLCPSDSSSPMSSSSLRSRSALRCHLLWCYGVRPRPRDKIQLFTDNVASILEGKEDIIRKRRECPEKKKCSNSRVGLPVRSVSAKVPESKR
ncbi:armadillo-type protein [Mycena leptocephala]|nr:armadillo-type protein [Mycena leptocephala]